MHTLKITGGAVMLVFILASTLLSARSFSQPLYAVTASVPSSFYFDFRSVGTLREKKTESESTSPYWWLRSGGMLSMANGIGKSIQGSLPTTDPLRTAYAASQPLATDNGYHPQNMFNLVLRKTVQDSEQSIYARILRDNLSNSANSHAWNGISLYSRYANENSFYYAGIRADGGAVIKKKGTDAYHTLAFKKIFPGTYASGMNLLPHAQWIGLRMDTKNQPSGAVRITLHADVGKTGTWTPILEVLDDGSQHGAPITASGRVAIRSDFMDIELDDFRLNSATGTTATQTSITKPLEQPVTQEPAPTPAPTAPATSGNTYGLAPDRIIQESGSLSESSDSAWWVNSGAYFRIAGGIGATVKGALPATDPWRVRYAAANPLDTDNGTHPQNIFRLLTKQTWQDYEQTGYFRIVGDNLSDSPNREGHNGILFFNRYRDGNNLYYTGLRVDGKAVIKKKINGTYYTMATASLYPGTYNRTSQPNLLPHNQWLGLRSVVRNTSGGVSIKLYVDTTGTDQWSLALETTDTGSSYGTPLTAGAHVGIRTDFMDVEVQKYQVRPL